MKILFFGDIMGKTGRAGIREAVPILRQRHQPDLLIANVENLAHGKGVTQSTFQEMLDAGIDFFTSGNHIFDKPDATEVFKRWPRQIIRPANLVGTFSGQGSAVVTVRQTPVLVVNLLGRVFMEKQFDFGEIGNPFLQLNEILNAVGPEVKIKLLDFHAEATSEKRGMGFWADGRMSAVFGTHTHIPTADAQILPGGTGFLTDVGMVGAADSVLGVDKEKALKRLLAGENSKEKVPLDIAEATIYEVDYVVLEIDEQTGRCQNIASFRDVINSAKK